MAILDTNILVDLIRRRPTPSVAQTEALLRSIAAGGDALMTTRFNVAELYLGAELSRDPSAEHDRIVDALEAIYILEFDDIATQAYGRAEAFLHRMGTRVGDMDTLIASVALSQGQRLVTRNPRHFVGIPGLVVLHPS